MTRASAAPYGPVVGQVGGRQATEGDVATQIERFRDGGRARLRRDR